MAATNDTKRAAKLRFPLLSWWRPGQDGILQHAQLTTVQHKKTCLNVCSIKTSRFFSRLRHCHLRCLRWRPAWPPCLKPFVPRPFAQRCMGPRRGGVTLPEVGELLRMCRLLDRGLMVYSHSLTRHCIELKVMIKDVSKFQCCETFILELEVMEGNIFWRGYHLAAVATYVSGHYGWAWQVC